MTDHRSNGELHRADPAVRRRMQIVLAFTVVAGLAALVTLYLWLAGLNARIAAGDVFGYEHSLHRVLALVCVTLGLVGAIFAGWMFRLAAATKAERRWPPSSMRTSSDMRIRYLTSADNLVTQMKGGAIVLCLLCLAVVGWGLWLFHAG